MNRYDVGDTVRVSATFRNVNSALADPATVTCTFRRPNGTNVTATPTSSTTGVWTADTTVDDSGVWRYRFEGTDTESVAEEGAFVVRRQRVIP